MVDTVAANLRDCFGSEIRKSFPLEDAAAAIRDYSANMTDGKVIFRMGTTPTSPPPATAVATGGSSLPKVAVFGSTG